MDLRFQLLKQLSEQVAAGDLSVDFALAEAFTKGADSVRPPPGAQTTLQDLASAWFGDFVRDLRKGPGVAEARSSLDDTLPPPAPNGQRPIETEGVPGPFERTAHLQLVLKLEGKRVQRVFHLGRETGDHREHFRLVFDDDSSLFFAGWFSR